MSGGDIVAVWGFGAMIAALLGMLPFFYLTEITTEPGSFDDGPGRCRIEFVPADDPACAFIVSDDCEEGTGGKVALVFDDAPAIVRELLAGLATVRANYAAETAEHIACAEELRQAHADRVEAEQRATKAEAEIEKLRAPVDAEGLVDKLRSAAKRHGDSIGYGSGVETMSVLGVEADAARDRLVSHLRALTASAAKWHAARRILDGAREAHEKKSRGDWAAREVETGSHGSLGEADDSIVWWEIDAGDEKCIAQVAHVDDADELNARGIVADHAAVDELLRLARGEG